MFSLLRRYNKLILVSIGSLLMVVFLIEGALHSYVRHSQEVTRGTLGDEKVTDRQVYFAGQQMEILRDLGLPPGPIPPRAENAALRWLLITEEARRMGLQAAPAEIETILSEIGYADEASLARFIQPRRISADVVRDAIGQWLISWRHAELVSGLAHLDLNQRSQMTMTAIQMMFQSGQSDIESALAAARGRERFSRPLLMRMMADQATSVQVSLVPIRPDLDTAPEPTSEQLQELFEEYRDDLPGEGEPYGFGYRFPRRARMAWLALPADRLRESVTVEYTDIVRYYDKNKDQFTSTTQPEGEGEPETVVKPLAEVESRIEQQLRRERGNALGEKIIRTARARLLEQVRSLPRKNGYLVLGDDFKARSLSELAQSLQEEFGVLPDVIRIDDRWLNPDDLTTLGGISTSTVAGDREVRFPDYVLSARGFEPDPENPLLTLRLQTGVPSEPMRSFEGSWYLFRLIEAHPAQSPQKLATVESAVREDAHRLNGYRQLLEEKATWLERAQTSRLEDIAEETGHDVRRPRPFARRTIGRDGVPTLPTVEGVGRSQAFIDTVFELAHNVEQAGGLDAPARDRIAVVGSDRTLSLILVRLEEMHPVEQARLEAMVEGDFAPLWLQMTVNQAVTAEDPDPLSLEALSERLDFTIAETDES